MALRPAVHSAATLRFYGHSRSLHPPPSRRPARDDFAQIMDELDFVKAQLARLPTRRDQAFVPLKIMFGSAASAPRSSFFGWKRFGGTTSEAARLIQ